MPTIVLADAGGPAAAAALPWLRSTHRARIVTVSVDMGQERDLAAVRDRALAAGAACAHVVDRREAFAREFLLPALKADATLTPDAWTALTWPLLAQVLVDVAAMEGATGVAHGCAEAGDAGPALEAAIRALAPDLAVLAAGGVEHRQDGRAVGGPGRPAPPDEAAIVDLAFARGVPAALNGIEMPLEELFASLETIAGAYAEGAAADTHAAPLAGPLTLGVLQEAHAALRRQVTDDRLNELCDLVARQYAQVIADGHWFSQTRRALDAFADEVQTRITGTVRIRLGAGRVERLAATSAFSRPVRRHGAELRAEGLPIAR